MVEATLGQMVLDFLTFCLKCSILSFCSPFFFPEKGVESRVFSSPKSEGCSVLQTPFWGSQLLFLVPPGGVVSLGLYV